MPCYDCRTVALMTQAYDKAFMAATNLRLLAGPDHAAICAALATAILEDGEQDDIDVAVTASNAVAHVLQVVVGPAVLAAGSDAVCGFAAAA